MTVYIACREDMFTCDDGRCIFASDTCDGLDDCSDWSDELHCGEFVRFVYLSPTQMKVEQQLQS